MDRETRRHEERERLVKSMAGKLATGNGLEVIAVSRRKKTARKFIYISIPVVLFIIAGIILYVKSPETTALIVKPESRVTQRISLLMVLHRDLEDKKINVNQYAFYLRDILIRYDSLPSEYRPARPLVVTEDIYDSLCAVWSKIDQKNRAQLFKELPKIENYLKEFEYKRKNREE